MSLLKVSQALTKAGHPLSVSVLSKMENGKRRIDVEDLEALTDVLYCSFESLALGDESSVGEADVLLDIYEAQQDLGRMIKSLRDRLDGNG